MHEVISCARFLVDADRQYGRGSESVAMATRRLRTALEDLAAEDKAPRWPPFARRSPPAPRPPLAGPAPRMEWDYAKVGWTTAVLAVSLTVSVLVGIGLAQVIRAVTS